MPATFKAIIAVTGVLSTLTVLGLACAGRSAERRNLLRHGCRVEGTVIGLESPGESTTSARLLRYQFTPVGHTKPVVGQCTVGVWAPYKSGDAAVICYNKAFPSSSIILSPKGLPL